MWRELNGVQLLAEHLTEILIEILVGLLQSVLLFLEFCLPLTCLPYVLRLTALSRLGVGLTKLLFHRVIPAADWIELKRSSSNLANLLVGRPNLGKGNSLARSKYYIRSVAVY